MNKIILLVVIIGFYSCNQKICTEERSITEMKKVFSDYSLMNDDLHSFEKYKLTKEDLKLTEELIEKAFLKFNNNLDRGSYSFEKLPNFKEYGYILSPCINKKGNKIVLINAYWADGNCSELGPLKEWYEVCDGGNSLIRFSINLSTKTVSNIMPNGEA